MLDKLILETDKIVKTLLGSSRSYRRHPDESIGDAQLSVRQKKHVLGLMRVNHCGEVCAQGLYQGQAMTAREKSNQDKFKQAALEETEHLAWTERRIDELGGKTSILNPFFYLASMAMGAGAGMVGDKWSLGFLAETEKQVGQHLESHLRELPLEDEKSRAILQQMKDDEAKHEEMAHDYGAADLPLPIKKFMAFTSKVMTRATYYI